MPCMPQHDHPRDDQSQGARGEHPELPTRLPGGSL